MDTKDSTHKVDLFSSSLISMKVTSLIWCETWVHLLSMCVFVFLWSDCGLVWCWRRLSNKRVLAKAPWACLGPVDCRGVLLLVPALDARDGYVVLSTLAARAREGWFLKTLWRDLPGPVCGGGGETTFTGFYFKTETPFDNTPFENQTQPYNSNSKCCTVPKRACHKSCTISALSFLVLPSSLHPSNRILDNAHVTADRSSSLFWQQFW